MGALALAGVDDVLAAGDVAGGGDVFEGDGATGLGVSCTGRGLDASLGGVVWATLGGGEAFGETALGGGEFGVVVLGTGSVLVGALGVVGLGAF